MYVNTDRNINQLCWIGTVVQILEEMILHTIRYGYGYAYVYGYGYGYGYGFADARDEVYVPTESVHTPSEEATDVP